MSQGQGFGFGLGKMKELTEAFKKAQQIQEGAKQLQEELEQMEIAGESGGGLVTVIMSGNQEPKGVTISPDALNEGAEVLSDLVTAAMKDAYEKSTATMRDRMELLTGGLNLPGL
ncbi:YbaB/EbfC family nucleoid-associated protein [Nodosilinea sp. E11]|uniref:YbaB/EbfC family nucleoid-associated protein n=1 Tax=Nodosilinea sp. E11 TaxID=3037479 RepID=UPI002934D564|nr:YbaB/EbfC family nucleoid-associated protein [Nodosilinea sp. E11]WOD39403.1 YbaB/EbfC family nucleoid-associated protein [Nodosilinea sp. E11]